MYGLSRTETEARTTQEVELLDLGLLQVVLPGLAGTLVHRDSAWYVLPSLGLHLGSLVHAGNRLEAA